MDIGMLSTGKEPGSARNLSGGNGNIVTYYRSKDNWSDTRYHVIQNPKNPNECVTIAESKLLKTIEKLTNDLYVNLTNFKSKLFDDCDFKLNIVDYTGKKKWPSNELQIAGKWMPDGSVNLGNTYENLTVTIKNILKEYNSMPNVVKRYLDAIIKGMCKGK